MPPRTPKGRARERALAERELTSLHVGAHRVRSASRWRTGYRVNMPGQMMRQALDTLRVSTKGRGFYEITRDERLMSTDQLTF